MNFFSILAEVKGEMAPARKHTSKVKSAIAPKCEPAKATSAAPVASRVTKRAPAKHPSAAANALTPRSSTPPGKREAVRTTPTASLALRVEKRAVTRYATPIAGALTSRLPTPAKSSPRPEEVAPRRPLPIPATTVRDTNRSAKPAHVTVAELLAPHPVAVQKAAARKAREEADRKAVAQQQARLQRRRDLDRRQPAARGFDQRNSRQPQQSQALEHPRPYAPEEERQLKRQSNASYENMSQHDLHNEAKFRALELDVDYKMYLIEVLVIDDKAFFESMGMLGDRLEAVEYAKSEVEQHNKELRQQRAAAAKAIAEKIKCEREARIVQQQAAREAYKKKQQEERKKTKKLALEKKAVEQEQAVEAPKPEQKWKRKARQDTNDSGYFSKPPPPAETGENINAASAKGKKRARSNDDDNEDKTPNKMAKSSKSSQPPVKPCAIKPTHVSAPLPWAVQARANKTSSVKNYDVDMSDEDDEDVVVPARPVKKTTKKTTQVKEPTPEPSQPSRRHTRSSYIVEDEDDGDMEGDNEDAEDDDAFVVDDGWKPTRKSRLNAREKSRLFAGM
ncbi:hypothetical protein G6011_11574 [Alternaria panax]|uniref:Uncharacterized protein n=1 Tax=Alternaria panax TaxID=48097 RepID=A0AAD4IE14_9PLEO|nr:hypothetical protein G6011_11574 [Alternaria panax]